MDISQAAFDLIVSEEVSGLSYYVKHYQHFTWPEGASGPTIGIGYDCGYVTPAEVRADWAGILPQPAIDAITLACGLRNFQAQRFVSVHEDDVTVNWDQAIAEFKQREVTKWVARVKADLPNCDKLSPDSLGALTSLAYNRGCSFDLPGPRYSEMRAIKAHMATEQFQKIPGEILSMRRLWPRGGGLWNRRTKEATLFQKGLA